MTRRSRLGFALLVAAVALTACNADDQPADGEPDGAATVTLRSSRDVPSGESRSGTVTLEPGTYIFYWAVPGHRDGGQEGTLTVEG